MNHRYLTLILAALLTPVSAWAQSKPLPRTPDGKPDLGGYWNLPQALRFNGDLAQGKEDQVPYTAAGREAFLHRDAADDPTAYCLPPGMPRMLHSPFPMLIMQSPGLVAQLFEYQKIWRLIYTDGRPHHPDVTDTFMGDSIGHWEGDTLVVETTNINPMQLEQTGILWPYRGASENLKVTERFTRTGPDTIVYRFTMEDPEIFTAPVTGELPFNRLGPEEMVYEYACHEGNYAMTNILSGERKKEAETAQKKPQQ